MRTNVVIDDALMAAAMELSGLRTKREVVEKAMLEFVQKRERKNLSELKGMIRFAENYDYKALRQGKNE